MSVTENLHCQITKERTSNRPKVSVIMPVYNAEEYLETSIGSWLNQSLKEKELICIDDGSTDNSLKIISKYCDQYENIKLLRQNNLGAGIARNNGMKQMQGEFVAFLDADDFYIDPSALEILYNTAIEGKLNICAGLLQVYENGKLREHENLRNNEGRKKRILYNDYQYDYCYQCYIFNSKFLAEKEISFPSFRRFQDPPFLVQALYHANEFEVVPIEFYGYRSSYKAVNYNKEVVNDLFKGLLFNLMFAKTHSLDKLLELTIKRINKDYFDVLYYGLVSTNKQLLKLMLEADEIITQTSFRIEPLECLLTCGRSSQSVEDYKIVKDLKIIPANSNIVLYGAGVIGQKCYDSIKKSQYCEIIMWIDRYKCGSMCKGENLYDISDIQGLEYDYVLIAVNNAEISNSIKKDLLKYEVLENKIVEWAK